MGSRPSLIKWRHPERVPGLPIRDCARGCNNRGQSRPIMSAIHVTEKTFFVKLYLILGLRKIALCVNCPYALTTLTVHSTSISRFLCNFFPQMASHFFGHHDSPSNLAKSRYPPPRPSENGVLNPPKRHVTTANVSWHMYDPVITHECVCECVRVCVWDLILARHTHKHAHAHTLTRTHTHSLTHTYT